MKLTRFQILNYRNVIDSGWVNVGDVTAFVGQNESGKSNLFEALYRLNPFKPEDKFKIEEDWPVDRWNTRDPKAVVCKARFELDAADVSALYAQAGLPKNEKAESTEGQPDADAQPNLVIFPDKIVLILSRDYEGKAQVRFEQDLEGLDPQKASAWVLSNLPKLVYIRDYELTGTRIELNHLSQRFRERGWANLTAEEQAIFIVLQLAKIDLDQFLALGQTAEGRTLRSFDKRAASAYLSKQFQELWSQKDVRFDIDVDNTTLNIFAEDAGMGMPVRLSNRSTGFRWHVAFAWKFTYASSGEYKNCIVLLEEPGVHLHYDGQRDLLKVFDRLAENNQILYTTHLSSMIDPAFPERVRIVEVQNHHAKIVEGVVSNQRRPMAVIEARLGLTGDLSGLLGSRQTLIVEGGDDALILQKLSGLLRASGKEGLSERIYLWPAEGASKTPMFAGFLIGNDWDGAVLLDTDKAGNDAHEKIKDLYLKEMAESQNRNFRVLMLGKASGLKKTDVAIEDLLSEEFYLACVNQSYGITIKIEDLPMDGSTLITDRVEQVLKRRYGHGALDKTRVMRQMLAEFDKWSKADELPEGVAANAEKLFRTINAAFANAATDC